MPNDRLVPRTSDLTDMSAELIAGRRFGQAWRGFDPEEVRDFLAQVAAQVRSLRERYDAAETARREAEQRAMHPRLDEATLMAAVGEETAQILRSARSAAQEIVAKAEASAKEALGSAQARAEGLLAEASSVLASRLAEAEEAAAAQLATAEAEAGALREEAQAERTRLEAEGRAAHDEMVEAARALREKVLSDLARRRKLAMVQIEQLRAGRERLLDAYLVVRRTLDEVTDELQKADAEARAASEAVGQQHTAEAGGPLDLRTEETWPAGPPAGQEQPSPVRAGDQKEQPAPVPAAGGRASAPAGANPSQVAAAEPPPKAGAAQPPTTPVVMAPKASEMAARTLQPRPSGEEQGPGVAPAPSRSNAPAAARHQAGTGFDSSAPGDVVESVRVLRGAAPATTPRRERHNEAAPPPGAGSPGHAETGHGGPGDSKQEAGAPGAAGGPERGAPAPGPAQPDAEALASPARPGRAEAGGGEADEGAAGRAEAGEGEGEGEGGSEATPQGDEPRDVQSLFARIRAGREEAASSARRALSGPAGAEAPAGVHGDDSARAEALPTAPAPGPDEELRERALTAAQADFFARRDQLTTRLEASLARKLKRALQDEQNSLLDRLRSTKGAPTAAGTLPSAEEQPDRFIEVGRPLLEEAARSGAALVGDVYAGTGTSLAGGPELVEDLAEELGRAIAGPLRQRLEAAFSAAGEDSAEVADALGVAYREWKTQRIEATAHDQVAAAFSRGAYLAFPDGAMLQWVVSEDEGPCPDCDDNSLAGAQRKGEAWPTGQLYPPAHPGCRCALARVVGGTAAGSAGHGQA